MLLLSTAEVILSECKSVWVQIRIYVGLVLDVQMLSASALRRHYQAGRETKENTVFQSK